MTVFARSLIDCCAEDPNWDRLLPQLKLLERMQSDLAACLPHSLHSKAAAASFQNEVLTVAVTSAALATKLKQVLPRINDGLESRGWKVSAIQVRVQPEALFAKSNTYAKRERIPVVSDQARSAISDLAGRLEEGPLRRALERFAARH